jgi:hypothetical protein
VGALAAIVLCTAAIAWLAMLRMATSQYYVTLAAAWKGAATTAPQTVPAALVVWLVLALTLGALTMYWRRGDELDRSEAIAAAIITLWSVAYVALLALGPFGAYRPFVLRALVIAVIATALLARRARERTHAAAPPPIDLVVTVPSRRPVPAGAWIAVGSFLLVLGPLLLMQIGSPVSPFMDVLPLVASVQKIVAFSFYDPYANDPSGFVALGRNAAGYDAPWSFLALVAGLPAWLAMTALIVPLCALQIFGLYRLGRVFGGAFAGGFATLLLTHAFTWRRTTDIRGTTIAFAIGALALALLLEGRRRGGVRTALGGLGLGLAVTINPLIGAVMMLVAAVMVVIAWIDTGGALIAPVFALGAASLFASPQVLIGLVWRVPPWVLPLLAIAGALLLVVIARTAAPSSRPRRRSTAASMLAIAGVLVWSLFLYARRRSEFFDDGWLGYPMLTLFAGCGLVIAAGEVWRRPWRRSAAAVPAVAIAVGMAVYMVASPRRFGGDIAIRSLTSEVTTKMLYYCTPYWLALAGGLLFAVLARRWARVPTIVLALLLVIYPVRHVPESLDFDASELSLAETWTFHLAHAARGYWSGYPDRRWVLDQQWRDAASFMQREIAAGRVDYDTHVVLIVPSQNNVELALGSGVSVDVYPPQYSADNIWLVGTRVQGPDALPAALAARPPYIMIQPGQPQPRYPELADYDEVLARNLFRLFRRRDLAPAPVPQ